MVSTSNGFHKDSCIYNTYNFVSATDVPRSKVNILVSDSLHIEACRRKKVIPSLMLKQVNLVHKIPY